MLLYGLTRSPLCRWMPKTIEQKVGFAFGYCTLDHVPQSPSIVVQCLVGSIALLEDLLKNPWLRFFKNSSKSSTSAAVRCRKTH